MLARAARVALLVASCAAIPTLARAGAPREPRRVLILNSYHPGFQWTDGETNGVLAALGGSPKDIQVYVEYMGSKWASSPKYFRELRDAYATKYRDVRFDAIVATDDDALRFLVDYREEIFGEVPTVFCGVNDFSAAQLRGRGLYTGVNEVFDVRRSLDLALRLHPATRRIAVVTDSSISGCKIRDQFARGAREYAPRLAFEYLGERPLEEVLDRIAHLPSDSLVFHLVYFSDWRGKAIDNEETASLVSRASRVPVYGGWEFSLGHGIVGGKLLTGRDQGLLAGEMARRILAGARVDQVPVVMESQSRFMFDHEQLRRFGIREADLPVGSVIVNAPPSFYTLNKALVWAVLGSLGVLSLIVVLLQASRSRLQRTEEALREAKEWLDLTIEATGAGTLHTVPYGGPATVSPRFREVFGLIDDAPLQDFEAFLLIVHPEDRDRLREAVGRGTDPSGDGLCEVDFRCVRPLDGTVRWIKGKAKTQFADVEGVRRGVRYAFVGLDVTDRKREEEALRESEERFRGLITALPVAVYTCDREGRITFYNEQAKNLWGRCPEIGRDLWCGSWRIEGIDGSTVPLDECPMAQTLKTGQRVEGHEIIIERPDGGRANVIPHPEPLHGASGAMVGAVNVLVDITDRKRKEEALRESEERFRTLAENIPEHIFITDRNAEFLWINRRFRDYSGDAVMGRGYVALIHPDHRGRAVEHVKRCLDTGEPFEETLQARGTEGQYRWFLSRVVPLRDDAGNVVRWLGTRTDVTEQREVEEALRESEARYARLAATVPGVLYEFERYPDDSGRFTYLSARCKEVFETDGQEFLKDLDRMVQPEDRRALREASLAASRCRSPLSVEIRITTPSGRSKWVQFTSLSCSASSDEVDRRSGLIVDITERKRAEEALREAQEWLTLTVEATGAGILNTVPFAPPILSPRFREMLGLPDDHGIDGFEAFHRLVHPEDREMARARVLQALEPSGDGRFEHVSRFLRPDGSVRWLAVTGKVQFAEVDGARRAVRLACVYLDITDRKREEHALRESEERFHALAENIPQHAFMLDASGQVFWINRHARDYAGNEGMGSGYLALIHPDHRGRVGEKVKRCLETGATFEEIFPFRGTEGQYRWFLCRVVPLRDDAGNVVRWFGTNTDVTEQREVEEALRESEATGRAILASLAEGVVLHDADGKVTTANEAAETLLGVSRDEMAGRTMFDTPPRGPMLRADGSLLPPEEHPVTLALQTGGGHGKAELGMRRRDGKVVWLEQHAQPVRLPDGKVAGVVSSFFDVTQRRRALERSEEHLRTMADNVPDAIVRYDRELRIRFANEPGTAAIGAPLGQLIGKTKIELGMPPERAALWDEYVRKVFRTGSAERFEFGFDGPDGPCFESRLVPERDRDGAVETVLSITRDITERKQAERQLLASREQLRELVARLNSIREEEKARLSRELHDEMGQLLTALRLELEVLEDRLADLGMPGEVRDLLDRAVAASELVTKTVQAMRSILSSLRPLALDRLGLDAALRQECRRFEEWAGIPCDFVATDGLSSFGAEADTALFRIAQEALTNVARHAGASRVAVRLGWTMGAALLKVEDDGRGIRAGHESTGLGLLGMRERTERLGGDLAVKPGPRGGTTVEARIPSGDPTVRKEDAS